MKRVIRIKTVKRRKKIMMRLKIVYTGDPTETKVVDSTTGEEVGGIHAIEVSIDAFSGYASLILQDFILEAEDMEGDILDPQEPA